MENKNIAAQLGYNQDSYSDEEFIELYGLNPSENINDQMFEKARQANVASFLQNGMTEEQAQKEAARLLSKTKAELRKKGVVL